MNQKQSEQIHRQITAHQHTGYTIDLQLSKALTLERFLVEPGVFRPEITTSIEFARFFAHHPELVSGKSVLDLGCGTGIQGVTAALLGAAQVVCTDISQEAVANTRQNVERFSLLKRVTVGQSDLFQAIHDRCEVIIFNHPFFDGPPDRNQPFSTAMLDEEGRLFRQFLGEAANYLSPGGTMYLNYFGLAGPTNDPKIVAPDFGWIVRKCHRQKITTGLQRGWFTIYELSAPAKS